MTTVGKFILIILILSAIGGFLFFSKNRNGAVTEKNANPAPVATATSTSKPALAPQNSEPKADLFKLSVPAIRLAMLVPQTGDAWRINTPHAIELNRPAGATGGIFLADAATKKVVGWIASDWGDNQDSFLWDTKTVFLTRSSSQKKEVQPGTYIIEAVFNARALDNASGIFRIVETAVPEIITYSVRLKDFAATPPVLTVRRGAKVIFINNESKRQTISASGFGPFAIDAGKFLPLDTAALGTGSYFYASDLYLNRGRGTLIVE